MRINGIHSIYSILFLALATQLNAQRVAVEYPRALVAYPKWTSQLTIIAENTPCEELWVTTDNGKIEGEDCEYKFTAEFVGKAKVSIHRIIDRDTTVLEHKTFYVKRYPLEARIGYKTAGTMSKGEIKATEGIYAAINGMDIDARFPIQSFQMAIVREEVAIKVVQNQGGRFSSEVKEALEYLQAEDRVIFENILARSPGRPVAQKLNDIYLKIK